MDTTIYMPITFADSYYTLVWGIECSISSNSFVGGCHLGTNMALADYKLAGSFKTRISTQLHKYYYACGPMI